MVAQEAGWGWVSSGMVRVTWVPACAGVTGRECGSDGVVAREAG